MEELTKEQIINNDHIPTSEIKADIEITKSEIKQYKEELDVLMKNPSNNRLEIMKREAWISERKKFVDKLDQIMTYRLEKENSSPSDYPGTDYLGLPAEH